MFIVLFFVIGDVLLLLLLLLSLLLSMMHVSMNKHRAAQTHKHIWIKQLLWTSVFAESVRIVIRSFIQLTQTPRRCHMMVDQTSQHRPVLMISSHQHARIHLTFPIALWDIPCHTTVPKKEITYPTWQLTQIRIN